jgi:hypothetical protein
VNTYRVIMHTSPSPGSTFYQGYVDVYADSEAQAVERAKQEAWRKGRHSPAGLVVDKIGLIFPTFGATGRLSE